MRQLERDKNYEVDENSPLDKMTKAQLISRSESTFSRPDSWSVQRYEAADRVDDSSRRIGELEEQLVKTKVQLAQAETEKEIVIEKARKRIDELKSKAADYAETVAELEKRTTELRLSNQWIFPKKSKMANSTKKLMSVVVSSFNEDKKS